MASGQNYQNNGNDLYSNSTKNRKNPYKLSTGRKVANVLMIVFCVIFAGVGGVIVYAHDLLAQTYQGLASSTVIDSSALPSQSSSSSSSSVPSAPADLSGTLVKDPMVLNILLFGSDTRPGEESLYGNADTMMLLSIDNRHQKVKLTSFMRDIYVNIPTDDGGYEGKLNSAYQVGGPALSIETIERNFGVDIDRYAVVYFDTFPGIVNTLGGIEVDLTEAEADLLNTCQDPDMPWLSEGKYTLNGNASLAYVRIRKGVGDDFGRTARQRNFMMQIVKKMKTTKDPATLMQVLTQVLPGVTTNITINEMTQLGMNALSYMQYPMYQYRLPEDDGFHNAEDSTWGDVLVLDDWSTARERLARFVYEDTVDPIYGASTETIGEIMNQ